MSSGLKFPKKKRSTKKDSRIKTMVRQIARQEVQSRAEKKYHLASESAISVPYGTPTLSSLSDVAQGDTDISRDGDSLYARSVRVRGEWAVDGTIPTAATIRLIIFRWFPDSSTDAPAVTSILSSAYTSSARVVSAPYHHDMRSKYRILYDKNMIVIPSTAVECRTFDTGYIRLGFKINYLASGTHGSNKLYILITSSVNSDAPDGNYVAKMTFNDM